MNDDTPDGLNGKLDFLVHFSALADPRQSIKVLALSTPADVDDPTRATIHAAHRRQVGRMRRSALRTKGLCSCLDFPPRASPMLPRLARASEKQKPRELIFSAISGF